jgi:hypothetical protein
MARNKRRSHIHFIKQYEKHTMAYMGTRIVIFQKEQGNKWIYDLGFFQIHPYRNPKSKKYESSRWKVVDCPIPEVIQKMMMNQSLDGKYKMKHILYESESKKLENFWEQVLQKENIILSERHLFEIKRQFF